MKKIVKKFAITAVAAVLAVNFVSAAPDVGTGTDALPAGCNDAPGWVGKYETCKNAMGQEVGGPPGCTENGTGANCYTRVDCTPGSL